MRQNVEVGPAVVQNERDYSEARCGMRKLEVEIWNVECSKTERLKD